MVGLVGVGDDRGVTRLRVSGGDRRVVPEFDHQVLDLALRVGRQQDVTGRQLVAARQLGVIRRSLAAPISATDLAAGFVVARMVFALLQAALILVVGAAFFDVDWGNPLAVVAIVFVFAIVCAAAGLILGALATSPDQAPAIGVPISIGFAMLGGCMWPLFIVPDTVRQIGHLTPHAWAVDGLVEVVFGGGTIGSVGVELAVLAGFAVVLSFFAARSLRRVTTV